MTNKSFSDLRKQSSNIDEIAKKLTDAKKGFKDARFWSAVCDKAGNGNATIRFLPAPYGEGAWFSQYFEHSFKGPNGANYWDNCPTTIGLPCPVCEDNGRHVKQGEAGLQFVRDRKSSRKANFIANVLVINDPANPENNGKVFLFKYGKKIQEKLLACITPKFADDARFLPYDIYTGANFKLRITRIGQGKSAYASYDSSTFDNPAQIPGSDEELEKLWKTEYSLEEFAAPAKFKEYNVLKDKLDKVLNGTSSPAAKTLEQALSSAPAPTHKSTPAAPVAHQHEVVDVSELESLADLSSGNDEIEDLKSLLAQS